MQLQITQRCNENCKHCFASATPDGKHMSLDMMDAIVAFYKGITPAPIKWLTGIEYPTLPYRFVLTGGEPTEHPHLDVIIEKIAEMSNDSHVIIETNGMWYGDKDKQKMVEKVLDMNNVKLMLATSHHDFYPRYNKFMLQKDELEEYGFSLDSKIEKIATLLQPDKDELEEQQESKLLVDPDWYPAERVICLGRAKQLPVSKKANMDGPHPNCLYVFSFAQECTTFAELFSKLELHGRYGDPLIDVDGNVRVGVCQECLSFGNVQTDDPEEIFARISRAEPCGKCGLLENISAATMLHLRQMQMYGSQSPTAVKS